ncbi:hypothetical protein EW145_g1592 [Phellinidium pouzarii]|uniref:Metallo-beta-lactamase domain-containing protein n=1 Tax=Phellinidium pouzarii TaxID=167371 RepID=A0A4S4LDW5_9AGAM|nr:hypothetical protein EW145_g1592 [Phellinidium pouzarii]
MSQANINPLPPSLPDQAYCEVSALEGGIIQAVCHLYVTTAKEGEKYTAPSLAFLIIHAKTRAHLLFDLGVRHDLENYIDPVKQRVKLFSAQAPQDVSASLKKGGLRPEDITHVCLSHCHWDHVGNPALFSSARFIVGGESRTLFQPGYPDNPKSVFPANLLPEDRTDFLNTNDDTWKPIGPFPNAFDYFGDGSLYIVDAPGHLPGHMNILARTSPDGGWIYLAGDSAHDWRLLRGQGDIPDGHTEYNKEQSAETMRRISELMTLSRVRVILTHDNEFYEENKEGDAYWPGKIKSL